MTRKFEILGLPSPAYALSDLSRLKDNQLTPACFPGTASSRATAGSTKAAGPSERRGWIDCEKPDSVSIAAAEIATAPGYATGVGKTDDGEARTLARGDDGSRGTRTVRQDLQAAQDQARFHPGRRWSRHGQTLRQRLLPDDHFEVCRSQHRGSIFNDTKMVVFLFFFFLGSKL